VISYVLSFEGTRREQYVTENTVCSDRGAVSTASVRSPQKTHAVSIMKTNHAKRSKRYLSTSIHVKCNFFQTSDIKLAHFRIAKGLKL